MKRAPSRYSDSEYKAADNKKSEKMDQKAAPEQRAPASASAPTDPAMISRPSMQYVPSPQEIPNFRGHVLEGEPPATAGTPEVDVQAWLELMEAHFRSTGLTDNQGRIMQLVQHTHKKLGDARGVVHRYLSKDYAGYTYEEAKEDLLKTYSSAATVSFVDAARDYFDAALSAKPGKINACNNISALRDASIKVATTFTERPCYNAEDEKRALVDVFTEILFAIASSIVFSKRVITETLLKRKENMRVAGAYQTLTHHINASEKDVYRRPVLKTVSRLHSESKKPTSATSSETAYDTSAAPTSPSQYARGSARQGRRGRGRRNNNPGHGGYQQYRQEAYNGPPNNRRGGYNSNSRRQDQPTWGRRPEVKYPTYENRSRVNNVNSTGSMAIDPHQ